MILENIGIYLKIIFKTKKKIKTVLGLYKLAAKGCATGPFRKAPKRERAHTKRTPENIDESVCKNPSISTRHHSQQLKISHTRIH